MSEVSGAAAWRGIVSFIGGRPLSELSTGSAALSSLGSGSVVSPTWLNSGPRMNPSIDTVCDLRPKRPTKPRS